MGAQLAGGRFGTWVRVAVAALAAGLVLAGCGDDAGDDAPSPSPSSPAAPSPSPSPSSPVLPTPPPGVPSRPPVQPSPSQPSGEMTITGELVSGVEPGCLLLDTGAGEYLLFGEPVEQLRAGGTATLRGRVRSDMMSTCQQGTPFEVTEVLG